MKFSEHNSSLCNVYLQIPIFWRTPIWKPCCMMYINDLSRVKKNVSSKKIHPKVKGEHSRLEDTFSPETVSTVRNLQPWLQKTLSAVRHFQLRQFQPWETFSPGVERQFQPWETFSLRDKRHFQPWETFSLEKISALRNFQP